MTLKVGVLISGSGTNLQAILDAAERSSLFQVVLVISNVETAAGLQRAQKKGIPAVVVRERDFSSRELFEEALIKNLRSARVELIALAGFMRLLTKKFVDSFRGRIMNIHPALLPAFPGKNAIERAWKSGEKITGVTVHFVDEGVDTGPILLQKTVPIHEGESLESLTERIHELEHQLYPEAIRRFAEDQRGRSPACVK